MPSPNLLKGQDLQEITEEDRADNEPHGTVWPCDDNCLTLEQAARLLLHDDEAQIRRAVENNCLVGLLQPDNAYRIPAEQFCDGAVVPGVAEVLRLFARQGDNGDRIDHKDAWFFLSTNLYVGGPAPRPIDKLRDAAAKGKTREVLVELARAKESFDYGDHF